MSHRCYQSYLLRVWKEDPDGELRASLRNVSSGECRHYASLIDLNILLSNHAERDFIQKPPNRLITKILNAISPLGYCTKNWFG